MSKKTPAIKVKLLRITSTDQPGWVECVFTDIYGKQHFFEEKIPILTAEDLFIDSEFPAEGSLVCRIVEKRFSAEGKVILHVNTDAPRDVESYEGVYDFEIDEEQLTFMDWG